MNSRELVRRTIEFDSPPGIPRQTWLLPWAEDHYPAGGGYYYVRKRGSISRAPVHGDKIWTGEVKGRDALQSHITSIGEDIQDSVQRCLEMIDTIRSGDLSPQLKCRERYCKFLHICRRGDA